MFGVRDFSPHSCVDWASFDTGGASDLPSLVVGFTSWKIVACAKCCDEFLSFSGVQQEVLHVARCAARKTYKNKLQGIWYFLKVTNLVTFFNIWKDTSKI